MEIRELVGYLLIAVIIAGVVAAVWAAQYYSPGRVHARQRAAAIKKRREASTGDQSAVQSGNAGD